MTTITGTGLVSDSSGANVSYSFTFQTDAVTVTSAVVTPNTAPAGTARTLTVIASSSAGLPLTFATPVGTGLTFTPVAGQPAGQAQWTFVG